MTDWGRLATTSGTRPQRRLHDLLWALGFDVEDEVSVGGRFSLDCYVRELHLGFEADGPYHRRMRSDRARDVTRDAWIMAHAGVPVLRLTDEELSRPDGDLLPRLRAFLDEHRDNAEQRRLTALRTGALT